MTLSEAIQTIGCRVIACPRKCEGVTSDIAAGVLPRCLILDGCERPGRGCVVVGINPGRSPKGEHRYYKDHGCSYDSVVSYWKEHSPKIPYYQRLQSLIRQLDLTGPVLWTELAKCESEPLQTMPLQTLRRCSRRFLMPELEAVPTDWPVLGIGTVAYKALAFLAPNRHVLGVPHPTGSWGHFARILAFDRLDNHALRTALKALSSPEPQAEWLCARAECSRVSKVLAADAETKVLP